MPNTDLIEHISSYCDRWCERCAFTSRCSLYAVHVATAMCDGDFEAGLELALGSPAVPDQPQTETVEEDRDLEQPTEKDLAEAGRELEARRDRIDGLPIATLACKVTLLTHAWLDGRAEDCGAAVPTLAESLAVATWDFALIEVKLRRALSGRDEFLEGDGFDDDPVQNDWNGSAKVALISIARSIQAWAAIAEATSDADAAHIADELRTLRDEAERMFPDAWRFIRPGFDTASEPGQDG